MHVRWISACLLPVDISGMSVICYQYVGFGAEGGREERSYGKCARKTLRYVVAQRVHGWEEKSGMGHGDASLMPVTAEPCLARKVDLKLASHSVDGRNIAPV